MSDNPANKLREVGSLGAAARHFGVTREAIRLWMHNGVPVDRALAVEEYSKGLISATEILRYAAARRDARSAGALPAEQAA